MKKAAHFFLTIGRQKYFFSLELGPKETLVHCEAAKIHQEFLNEDIPALLFDLGNLIIAEKEYMKKKDHIIRFRITSKDKNSIEKRAFKKGYTSISGYLRDLAMKA